MGVVADCDDEVLIRGDFVQVAWGEAPQVQAVPAGYVDGAGCNVLSRVCARRGGRDVTGLAPEGGGQLGAGAVVCADKQDPASRVPGSSGESGQRAGGEADVAAAPVRFGAVPPDQSGALEGAQMVREQVRRDAEFRLQLAGGVVAEREHVGSVLANMMFDVGTSISSKDRITAGHLLGEVVATAGLVLLIFSLARTNRGLLAAPAVGAYIGAAYWFTSSTSFANPAVTVGRIFSDTFAGITPGSVPGFILAQIIGAALGLGLLLVLFPAAARAADDVVIPHPAEANG